MKSISLYCILDCALAWSLSHPWSDSTTIQYMEHTSSSTTLAGGYWYNVWNMTWALRSVPSWRAETIFTIIYHRLPPAFRLTDHWDSVLLLTITQYHTHCNEYKTITQFPSLLNCSLSLLLLSITQLWLITKVTHYNISRIRVRGLTYLILTMLASRKSFRAEVIVVVVVGH